MPPSSTLQASSQTPWRSRSAAAVSQRPIGVSPLAVSATTIIVEVVALAVTAMLAYVASGDNAPFAIMSTAAGLVAFLHVVVGTMRGDYSARALLAPGGQVTRVLTAFLLAVAVALTVAFLTKTSAVYSRNTNVILVGVGSLAVVAARIAMVRTAGLWAKAGRLVVSRIMLVGTAREVEDYVATCDMTRFGLRLVGASVLRETSDSSEDDLALAVATARMHRPDAVYLLLPWTDQALVGRAVDALRLLPAAIHLGPTPLLDRFADLGVDRASPIASIRLVRVPMSPLERWAKRVMDIVLASVALVALCPVLLLIAAAIKMDSPGPIFFRQRRTGYNQQPFRIFKFRSMSTMEDTAALRQVTNGDARVTRLGRLLRRSSLDELPQLFNVLQGEMSLVGPRPHALAHDRLFERDHAIYRRRHNMRPGITGWAQVNGFRGETDTADKVAGRLRHDLVYVDNWSIWLDLRILMLTVASPRTFRNAK